MLALSNSENHAIVLKYSSFKFGKNMGKAGTFEGKQLQQRVHTKNSNIAEEGRVSILGCSFTQKPSPFGRISSAR